MWHIYVSQCAASKTTGVFSFDNNDEPALCGRRDASSDDEDVADASEPVEKKSKLDLGNDDDTLAVFQLQSSMLGVTLRQGGGDKDNSIEQGVAMTDVNEGEGVTAIQPPVDFSSTAPQTPWMQSTMDA